MDSHDMITPIPKVNIIIPKLSDKLWEDVLSVGRSITFPKGYVINLQDAAIGGFFCVAHGKVKVSQNLDDGTEVVFSFYTRGNIFGEASALRCDLDRPAATACTDAELVFLSTEAALSLVHSNSDFALFLMYSLSHKLSNLTALFSAAAGKRVLSRMVDILQSLETYGILHNESDWYTVSHAELASLTGTTRSNVTVLLHQLSQDRLIALRRNQIKIIDIVKLRDYAPDSKK